MHSSTSSQLFEENNVFLSYSAALCSVYMLPNSFKLDLHPFKSLPHGGKHIINACY